MRCVTYRATLDAYGWNMNMGVLYRDGLT